jgi:predicted dienelactone hydrolase
MRRAFSGLRLTALSAALAASVPAISLSSESGRDQASRICRCALRDRGRWLLRPVRVSEGATRFTMPFNNLTLYKDTEVAFDGTKRPLIVLSHRRGSNDLFLVCLASDGYVVAAPYHRCANTYDSTTALWQRPTAFGASPTGAVSLPPWEPNRQPPAAKPKMR